MRSYLKIRVWVVVLFFRALYRKIRLSSLENAQMNRNTDLPSTFVTQQFDLIANVRHLYYYISTIR